MVNRFHWFWYTFFLKRKPSFENFLFLYCWLITSWLNFCPHSPATVFFIHNNPCFPHLKRNLLIIQWYKFAFAFAFAFALNIMRELKMLSKLKVSSISRVNFLRIYQFFSWNKFQRMSMRKTHMTCFCNVWTLKSVIKYFLLFKPNKQLYFLS